MYEISEEVALEIRRLKAIHQEKTKELIIKKLKKSNLIKGKFTTKKLAYLLQAPESTVRKWFNTNTENRIPQERLRDIAILLGEEVKDICYTYLEVEFDEYLKKVIKEKGKKFLQGKYHDFLYKNAHMFHSVQEYENSMLYTLRLQQIYNFKQLYMNDLGVLLNALAQLDFNELLDILQRIIGQDINDNSDVYISNQIMHYIIYDRDSENKSLFKLLAFNKNDKYDYFGEYIDALSTQKMETCFNRFISLETISALLYIKLKEVKFIWGD